MSGLQTSRLELIVRGILAASVAIALVSPNLFAETPVVDSPQNQPASGDQRSAPAADGRQAVSAPPSTVAAASSVDEARLRARVMYDTIRGALQVMHRDFFLEDESHTLPSQSLQDVFDNLMDDHGIHVNWITVNADEMNTDHRPVGSSELEAVKRLHGGAITHEISESDAYHLIGAIRLSSQCLKCHVKHRKSLEPRMSGLHIRIPLEIPAESIKSGKKSTREGKN